MAEAASAIRASAPLRCRQATWQGRLDQLSLLLSVLSSPASPPSLSSLLVMRRARRCR